MKNTHFCLVFAFLFAICGHTVESILWMILARIEEVTEDKP